MGFLPLATENFYYAFENQTFEINMSSYVRVSDLYVPDNYVKALMTNDWSSLKTKPLRDFIAKKKVAREHVKALLAIEWYNLETENFEELSAKEKLALFTLARSSRLEVGVVDETEPREVEDGVNQRVLDNLTNWYPNGRMSAASLLDEAKSVLSARLFSVRDVPLLLDKANDILEKKTGGGPLQWGVRIL